MSAFGFDRIAADGAARRGRIRTAHGTIETPAFMPVGTAATVKAMTPEAVAATGAEILLGNTYHLMLRPGAERVERLGGLHKFMNWPHAILTDSGGYQVMSLAELRKLSETGVTFRSHIDGQAHELTPERSIQIQHALGADITMAFDECTPYPAEEGVAADSMRLSMRWAERSKAAFVERPGHGLFGIVQGSVYPDLRAESVASLTRIGFDGHAVGGLAVGEGQATMFEMLDITVPLLPADRPRYLMGVGKPMDLVGSVRRVKTETAKIELKDGQSFAIAGLIDNRLTDNASKIPGLGDIPIIGKLFRSRSINKSKTELLVMVTPRLVKPLAPGQVPTMPDFKKPFLDNNKFDGKSGETPPKKNN